MTIEAVLTLVAAAVASFVATGLIRRLALRRGLLDAPEAERRMHRNPTPRLGGVGIVLGLALGWTGVVLFLGRYDFEPFGWKGWHKPEYLSLLLGSVVFFGAGLLDDVLRPGISPGAKLLLQVMAATLAVVLGLRFEGVAKADPWPALEFGPLSAPMTILWLVAVVNLVNFMDGIDWIAAGTVLVVVLSRGLQLEGWDPQVTRAVPSVFLATGGAILGFAVWNAPPAKIFMGDGGSHFLGFCAAIAACSSLESMGLDSSSDGFDFRTRASWAVTAAALLPAVVDVSEALIHKVRHGIPLSQAHHDHLYQRLVKAGQPVALVAIRYTLLAATGAVLAGPVASRWGVWAALVPGAAIMALHLSTAARAVRDVPRLQAS